MLAGHDAKNDSSSGSSIYPCSSTSVCEFLEVMIARLNNYHELLFHGGHCITPCTSLHVLLKGTGSSMTDSNDSLILSYGNKTPVPSRCKSFSHENLLAFSLHCSVLVQLHLFLNRKMQAEGPEFTSSSATP
jgi:hypothetical protein